MANLTSSKNDDHDNHGHEGDPPTDHEVVFTIDKQKFTSPTDQLTPRQLLVDYAKEDPKTTTLAEKHGNQLVEHKDLDVPITIKNGAKFVVFHQKPTPVS